MGWYPLIVGLEKKNHSYPHYFIHTVETQLVTRPTRVTPNSPTHPPTHRAIYPTYLPTYLPTKLFSIKKIWGRGGGGDTNLGNYCLLWPVWLVGSIMLIRHPIGPQKNKIPWFFHKFFMKPMGCLSFLTQLKPKFNRNQYLVFKLWLLESI
jgi:hypothetical protein